LKGKKDQPVIRDSRDPKYFVNKDHPQHEKLGKTTTALTRGPLDVEDRIS